VIEDFLMERASGTSRNRRSGPLIPAGWEHLAPHVEAGFGSRHAGPPTGIVGATRQVHGATLVRCAPFPGPPAAGDCDGLIVEAAGLTVGVRTADCVPVLLAARSRPWAAAVHAGWRGTVAGIVERAVEAAFADGIDAGDLIAALGPSIGPCCYEVGEEVVARFHLRGWPVREGAQGRRSVDLRDANRRMLEASGVASAAIVECGPCTRCQNRDFHSFRADPEDPGRQWSWISLSALPQPGVPSDS
jgi:YfiH family protein